MTGANAPVIHVSVTVASERHHVPLLRGVAMIEHGKPSVMLGQRIIYIVPTHSVFTLVNEC